VWLHYRLPSNLMTCAYPQYPRLYPRPRAHLVPY
jgi:hypothetical protein